MVCVSAEWKRISNPDVGASKQLLILLLSRLSPTVTQPRGRIGKRRILRCRLGSSNKIGWPACLQISFGSKHRMSIEFKSAYSCTTILESARQHPGSGLTLPASINFAWTSPPGLRRCNNFLADPFIKPASTNSSSSTKSASCARSLYDLIRFSAAVSDSSSSRNNVATSMSSCERSDLGLRDTSSEPHWISEP